MQTYEYKVVPAPNRPKRFKGVKGNAARFAEVLAAVMNDLATQGWEYLRSDSMPVEERTGLLKGRTENYHTILVFRRAKQPAELKLAGFLEDHSAREPVPEPDAGAAFPLSAPRDDFSFPDEPPLTAPAPATETVQEADDDGPFAEPDDTPDQILRLSESERIESI